MLVENKRISDAGLPADPARASLQVGKDSDVMSLCCFFRAVFKACHCGGGGCAGSAGPRRP